MDSYAVKKLYTDARGTLESYLSKDLTDAILGDMLRKYHFLLTDAELLGMIEVQITPVSSVNITNNASLEEYALWNKRLNHLAKTDPKSKAVIEALNAPDGEHNGCVAWVLK